MDTTQKLHFRLLKASDREQVQEITLNSGRRNCNFNFTNLIGWHFWFDTEFCIVGDSVVLRFYNGQEQAYMLCSSHPVSPDLLAMLCADVPPSCGELRLLGLEDHHAAELKALAPDAVTVTPMRDRYDYIYLRRELASVQGKSLKNKRNHINKFLSEHPDFVYRDLTPDQFDDCLRLANLWRGEVNYEEPRYNDTVGAEKQMIGNVFNNWEELGAIGGCIYVNQQMIAFTFGAAVTHDTFDVCVEKADRNIDGAFNIINQQFAAHLPEEFVYINREEDMGLAGLRKSKLSYHPHQLLSFNNVTIKTNCAHNAPCHQTT